MSHQKAKPTYSRFAILLARLFNLAPHETPRVAFAWSLKFFWYVGYAIGWTMLTAMLVNRLGIEWLPLLFVANAGLTILGTTIFSEIIHRWSRKWVLLGTLISGVILLGAALTALNGFGSLRLFFGFALVAHAVFFTQLNILIGLFVEDLFSPLEGERAWPLIGTSKYIGGIVGGLTILFGISMLRFEASQLTIFWAGSVAVMLPLLLGFYTWHRRLPSLSVSKPKATKASSLRKIREGLRHVRATPFLIGLVVIVMIHSLFYTLLNFQYTKAVDTQVSHAAEQTLANEPAHGSAENTARHEDLLTHDLGALYIGFSLLALFFQLFITSRVIERIGIVRTIAIHPAISLVSSLGLTLWFGFPAAVANKALFGVTTGMYQSAYYASFYALKEDVREHAKEFLEGLVTPIGVLLGTGLMLAVQYFFSGEPLTLAINLIMLVAMIMMGIAALWLRERYTHVSKKNLEIMGDHPAKFTSIEVLAQRGHSNAAEILVKNLLYKKESDIMQIKILETLGRIRDPRTIPEILTCFDKTSSAVKLAAVNALAEFQDLGKHFFTQSFTRFRVISALKELFEKEDSKEIRSSIVRVFANMHQAEVVPFLIETIAKADPVVRADCIFVCGLFRDISAAHYLEPYLQSEDAYTRANTIIALWQFPQYRLRLTILLTSLLEADDKISQKAAIHMLGEIGALQERPRLEKYLEHEDAELRLLAALALAKLHHERVPELLADFILHEDAELARLAKKHLRRIPSSMQERVNKIVHHRLSQRLSELLADIEAESLSELSADVLQEMSRLYASADDWHEVAKIKTVLATSSANIK